MKTLTIRKIPDDMQEAINYIKSLSWYDGKIPYGLSNKTNSGAITVIIRLWWKEKKELYLNERKFGNK